MARHLQVFNLNKRPEEEVMAEIRESVKSAIDTAADKAKGATDWVADKSEMAADRVQNVSRDTVRRATDTATQAKDRVGQWVNEAASGPVGAFCAEAATDTKEAVQRMSNELTDIVRKYPIASIAVGFGIGLLLGRTVSMTTNRA